MTDKPYPNDDIVTLIKALRSLQSDQEVAAFLRDILTLSELNAASQRYQIALLLWQGGKSYQEIADELKTSTTTVTRVADWLFHKDYGGYRTVLSRLHPKNETK